MSSLTTLKADHVLIRVSNFDETCKWYQDILGASKKLSWENDGLNFAYYDINGFSIEIVGDGIAKPFEKPKEVYDLLKYEGFRLLCFAVDDVTTAYKELKSKEVIFLNEPFYMDKINKSLVHFFDNNGNVLELMSEGKSTGLNKKN